MKKIYSAPMMEKVVLEIREELLAASILPGNGDSPTGIIPSDDIFNGEFRSNSDSSLDVWG